MKPYYVGFPRSGSHWVRISLEKYTDKKSPISNFLAAQNETVHQMYNRVKRGEFRGTHDMDLKFRSEYILYMFRNPIDCLYFHMIYENLDIFNKKLIFELLDVWIKHIDKWCFNEKFTKKKCIVSYECLYNNFVHEFSRILLFLDIIPIKHKIEVIYRRVDKQTIKDIIHDKKVINLNKDYATNRDKFRDRFGKQILQRLPESHKKLWKVEDIPLSIRSFWNE